MRLHQIITEKTHQNTSLLKSLPSDLLQTLQHLADVFDNAGHEIRIVGGAARDLVIGKDPKDIDMATDAHPEKMMSLLDAAGIRHEPTGLAHGTITAIINGEPIEITTLRIDAETDGRHARVEFTNDWHADAQRRDLTFNAMSMTLDGTLYDYFDGIDDLAAGRARFVGNADARMQEDYLRILRYFRFQGRLENPTWDPETMAAVARNAKGLASISGERVWMEMSKILSRSSRVDVLKRMDQTDVLEAIDMPNNRVGMVAQVSGNDPVVALSATLNTVGGLDSLRNRWKFSNQEYSRARFIIENRDQSFDELIAKQMLADPKINPVHIFALCEALGKGAMVERLKRWQPPKFPVTGSDLLAAGHQPGPAMGRTLAQLRQAWEASNFTLTKNDLLKDI